MINYQELTDQELLAEISDRNTDAFAALYDRYGKRVFGLSARILNDAVKSEEVTQDVFMRVWRRGHTYMPDKGKFTTWLFRIAHNRTIDELRKLRRDKSRYSDDITERYDLESDDISPPEAAVANSEYASVRDALNVLPEPQRQVVYLSYFEGDDTDADRRVDRATAGYGEDADAIGTQEVACRTRQRDLRRRMIFGE